MENTDLGETDVSEPEELNGRVTSELELESSSLTSSVPLWRHASRSSKLDRGVVA